MEYRNSRQVIAEQPRIATAPARKLPAQACDCHIHVSDGTGRFPIGRQTGYVPMHASVESHQAMRRTVGLQRSVAVQLMAYAQDNGLLLEALDRSEGSMRGIAEVSADVTDAELERLHAAGVRGLRFFLELPRSIAGYQQIHGAGIEHLIALAPRMRALNWVAEVGAGAELIVELAPRLRSLGVPIVLEHMAGCAGAKGAGNPAVKKILEFLGTGSFWVKLTVCRMSARYPDFEDMRSIHDAFIEAAPGRLVWGSDWPHGMMKEAAPDVGHLLDLFDEWIGHDEALRQTILSCNPGQLFGF
jgi:2-pyrone-4,6-dicarboxylate lactonase